MPSDISIDIDRKEDKTIPLSFAQMKQLYFHHRRMLWSNAFFIFIGAIGASAIIALGIDPWLRGLQLIAFLALGYAHIRSLQNNLSFLPVRGQLVYTMVLLLLAIAANTIVNFLLGFFSLWILLTAATAFLVPYSLLLAWQAFEELPTVQPPVWFYNDAMQVKQGVVSLHTMPIKLKVEVRPYESEKKLVSFSAPGRMKLGAVLYNILHEYRGQVSIAPVS